MPNGEVKSYKVNGQVYDVPVAESQSFLKDFPSAQEVQTFIVQQDTFDIPVSDVQSFLKDFPNAAPFKKKEETTSKNGQLSSKIAQPPSETVTTPISETKEEVPKEPVSPLEMFMGAGAAEEKPTTLVEGFVEKYSTPIDRGTTDFGLSQYNQQQKAVVENRKQIADQLYDDPTFRENVVVKDDGGKILNPDSFEKWFENNPSFQGLSLNDRIQIKTDLYERVRNEKAQEDILKRVQDSYSGTGTFDPITAASMFEQTKADIQRQTENTIAENIKSNAAQLQEKINRGEITYDEAVKQGEAYYQNQVNNAFPALLQSKAKIVADKLGLSEENKKQFEERYKQEAEKYYAEKNKFNYDKFKAAPFQVQAAAGLTQGYNNLLQTIGAGLMKEGFDESGSDILQTAKGMEEELPEMGKFDITKDPLDPVWWSTKAIPSLPSTVTLMAPALATGGATSALVGGGIRGAVAGGVTAAAVSRPAESMVESYDTYLNDLNKGLSPEIAGQHAASVFRQNLRLYGLDAAQYALLFAKVPLVLKGALETGSEYGEEVYQGFAQARQDNPNLEFMDYATSPEGIESGTIGAVMGLAFTGTGELLNQGQGSTYQKANVIYDMLKEVGQNDEKRGAQLLQTIEEMKKSGALTNQQYAEAVRVTKNVLKANNSLPQEIQGEERKQIVTSSAEIQELEAKKEAAPEELKSAFEEQIKAKDEQIQQIISGEEVISQSIKVAPDKIKTPNPQIDDRVELIDGQTGYISSIGETKVGRFGKTQKTFTVQLDKPKTDAEKQQSGQMRQPSEQVEVIQQRDSDMPVVNETELQDREAAKEKTIVDQLDFSELEDLIPKEDVPLTGATVEELEDVDSNVALANAIDNIKSEYKVKVDNFPSQTESGTIESVATFSGAEGITVSPISARKYLKKLQEKYPNLDPFKTLQFIYEEAIRHESEHGKDYFKTFPNKQAFQRRERQLTKESNERVEKFIQSQLSQPTAEETITEQPIISQSKIETNEKGISKESTGSTEEGQAEIPTQEEGVLTDAAAEEKPTEGVAKEQVTAPSENKVFEYRNKKSPLSGQHYEVADVSKTGTLTLKPIEGGKINKSKTTVTMSKKVFDKASNDGFWVELPQPTAEKTAPKVTAPSLEEKENVSDLPLTGAEKTTQPTAEKQLYKIGKSPQTYEIVEELPFDPNTDLEGEKAVRVRNTKTGAEEVVLETDLKPVKKRRSAEKIIDDTILNIQDFLDSGKGKGNVQGIIPSITRLEAEVLLKAFQAVKKLLQAGRTLEEAIEYVINKINNTKDLKNQVDIEKLAAVMREQDYGKDKPRIRLASEELTPAGEIATEPSDLVGVTHEQTDALATEFGLPQYDKDPQTVEEWDNEADRLISEGYNINELIAKMEKGYMPTPVEQRIMGKYFGTLDAQLQEGVTQEKLDALNRAKKASDVAGGRLVGQSLRSRQGFFPSESLAGFLAKELDNNEGAPLTENQIENVVTEYNRIKAAEEAWKIEKERLEEENSRLRALAAVRGARATVKKTKKTHEDYVAERKSIVDDIKKKLKESRGQTSAVLVPYAKELITISPDVAKLVKSFVEEGIVNLKEIISNIHPILKQSIPDITEKDVQDLIAGEYNEPKKPRSEIAKQVFDLRQQAKLTNRLQSLQEGIEPKTEKKKIERNRELENLRQQIRENDLTKLSQYKSRVNSQIQKLEEDLRTGNYAKPEKKPPIKLDKEGKEALDKLIKLRQEREVRILKDQYANRTRRDRAIDKVLEVLNVPRTIMSSMDFSAPLRQAFIASIAHPKTALGAATEMFRQSVSQKRFDRWFHEVKDHPRYNMTQDAGLYISDPHDPRLSAKEEAFMNNLAEKIPLIGRLIKGSERAYVGYLNKMRWDLFNRFADAFEENGQTFENSPKLYEDLASFINNATGRGKLGKLETSAPILNSLLFSPRLIASRLNIAMNPIYWYNLSPQVRAMAMKDVLKSFSLALIVLALFKYADDDDDTEVETDPRSSDFLKLKIGNTRWDILGGYQQYYVLLARFLSKQSKSANTGKIEELNGEGAFGRSRSDVVARFARGKLAPVPSMFWNMASGKTILGEDVTLLGEAESHLTPLMYSGMKEAIKDQGAQALLSVGVPSLFGVGVQTYLPRGYDDVNKEDPVYKFLYENNLNLTQPPQPEEMNDEQYKTFLKEREKIFKDEWKNVINYGAGLNKDEEVTIDVTSIVKTVPSQKLTQDQLITLMKSISNRATRQAKKEDEPADTKSRSPKQQRSKESNRQAIPSER